MPFVSYTTLALERQPDGVCTLRLDRPEVHNAMNLAMISDLGRVFADLETDETLRVLVLTGSGRSFCAGGDLGWMRAVAQQDRAQRIAESTELADMLARLNGFPKPVIARVNGPAYGGGVGLLSCVDIAIADDSAKFALTEVRLGLIPATISPYVVRRIGEPAARRLMLSGARFDAAEGCRVGLLARAVPAEALDAAVAECAQAFLQCSPVAVAATKDLIRFVDTHGAAENRDETPKRLADTWETADARAGIAAFLDKAAPPWRE